jgi:uncharacterized protein YbaR (Trm112 family)
MIYKSVFFVGALRVFAPMSGYRFRMLSEIKENPMAIRKELLEILACPKCKGNIYLDDSQNGLICDHCKLLYEIKDDIPIMLIDEAKSIK